MIAGILSILGSSAVGSLLGGIFAFLNRKADMEMKKLELAHEVARWTQDLQLRDKDIQYAREEAAGKKEVAIVEADGAIETARMQAIATSFEAEKISADELKAAGKWRWLLILTSILNRVIRPLITLLLAGTAIYINMMLVGRLTDSWSTLTAAQQYDAALQAFSWITGQAAAVLGYWFVSRGTPSK